MSHDGNDLQKIKELIEVMKANGLTELEIKHGDEAITLKRSQPQSPQGPVPLIMQHAPPLNTSQALPQAQNEPAADEPDESLVDITSPIVGTCYFGPSPDSDPFVEIGSEITPQSVVCIIEAMKVMNEIKPETSGTIVEIVAENGQAVEYGQVLFRLRPD